MKRRKTVRAKIKAEDEKRKNSYSPEERQQQLDRMAKARAVKEANEARRRAEMQARAAAGKANGVAAHEVSDDLPLPKSVLTPTDQARLALRQLARKNVKGSPTDLITLPGVQPLSSMLRFIDGGRERIIELIQFACLNNDPIATQWWTVFRELPAYPRSVISLDDVCAASNVKPRDLMIVLVSTAMDYGQDVGNLVASITHPKIVDAMVRSAERIDGPHADIALKDRHAFLQSRGVLPAPRGTVINVNASAQAAAAAATQPSVPSFAMDLGAVPQRAVPALPEALVDGDLSLFTDVVEQREAVAVAINPDDYAPLPED